MIKVVLPFDASFAWNVFVALDFATMAWCTCQARPLASALIILIHLDQRRNTMLHLMAQTRPLIRD